MVFSLRVAWFFVLRIFGVAICLVFLMLLPSCVNDSGPARTGVTTGAMEGTAEDAAVTDFALRRAAEENSAVTTDRDRAAAAAMQKALREGR